MAQNSAPNPSPQPNGGEKRFFRSKETIDILEPSEVPVEAADYRLQNLIADRQGFILAKHNLDLDDEQIKMLIDQKVKEIIPITDKEREDPSLKGRAIRRERLTKALSAESDDTFATICANYMREEAWQQGKRLKPDMARIGQLVEVKIDVTEDYKAELSPEDRKTANEILEEYKAEFASYMAKRSKRSLEAPGKREKIEETRDELADMLGAIAANFYFGLNDSLSDEVKSKKVDQYIESVTEQIISQIETERAAEYNKARPTFKKFYDKWAEWGKGKEDGSYKSTLLTKGKLTKAAVIAVPTALVTAVAAPFVTTGLAAGGAGAVAFMGARSVGRRLAGAKLDRASNITTVAHEQAELLRTGIGEKKSTEQDRPAGEVDGSDEHKARVELNIDHNAILEMIDKQSDYIRQRNLRRNLTGTAIALTVGLLSSRAASAVEGLVNYIQDDGTSGGRLERDGGHDRDRDGDGVNNRHDIAPDNPDIQTPSDIDGGPSGDTLERSDMFDGHQGTREFTAEGQKDFNRWISRNGGYEVKPGDSVWKLSERYLQANGNSNPTTYEVDAVKDSVLKELQAKGMADSRGWLTTGDTIKIK